MRKSKKKLSSFLAIVLIFALLAPGLSVAASDVPTLTMWCEKSLITEGDEFTVDINLNYSSNVYGGNFTLQYDSECMEVTEYAYGSNLNNHIKNCNLNYQSVGNLIRFTFSGSSPVTEDGTILTLKFVAKEKVGTAALTFNDYKMYGADGRALLCNAFDNEIDIDKDPESLELGVSKTATIVNAGDDAIYKFVPDAGGAYVFSSQGELFVSAYLIDKDDNYICGSQNEDGNFEFETELTEGATYYLISYLDEDTLTGSFDVLVEKKTAVTSIDIGNDLQGWAGIDTFTIAVEFLPEGVDSENITWSSSDASVATVSEDGNVTLVSAGRATITATAAGGATDIIEVTSLAVEEVNVGALETVEFEDEQMEVYYKFTPEKTGTYRFTVANSMYGYVEFEIVGVYGPHLGTGIQGNCELSAGDTYFIRYERVDAAYTGSYNFLLEQLVEVERLEIVSLPARMNYYEGNNDFSYEGLKLKAVLEDGTEEYWEYGRGTGMLAGHSVDITNRYTNDSYSHTEVSCAGKSVSFSFQVIENPVESIEIFSGEMEPLIENVDGYMSDYYGYFYYYVDAPYGLKFKINYTDGTSKIGGVNTEVDGYRIEWHNTQYGTPWTLGENYIVVSYCGKSVNVPVCVVKNTVESITLNTAPTHVYIWGDLDYGYTYNDMYDFWPSNLDGLSFTVNYTDGTSKIYTSDGFDVDSDGAVYSVDGEELNIQGYFNSATPGSYPVQVEYMGHKMEYEVVLENSKVSAIEVIKDPKVTTYGAYYLPDFTGMQVQINYNNGTSKIIEINENTLQYKYYSGQEPEFIRYIMVDDYPLSIRNAYDYSEETGYMDYYLISYMGQEYKYQEIQNEKTNNVTSIAVSNISLENESFKLVLTYSDETTETIEKSLLWYKDEYVGGGHRVYVNTNHGLAYMYISEEYDNIGCITAYKISVLENSIEIPTEAETLIIDSKPHKTSYNVGESLNLDGLKLKVKYSDGTSRYIMDGFTVSALDSTTAGAKTIKLTYGNLNTSFVVNVISEELETDAPQVIVSSATANRDKQVKVNISLENNPGIASATLRIQYDSSVMTLVEIEDKGNLGAAVHSDQFTNPYVLNWVNDTITENIVFNGEVVTLIFEVAENAALGEYVVSAYYDYDNYDIYNVDAEKVKLNTVDGIVSIVDTLIGDVNSDGTVNNLDRMVLTRYLANWKDYTGDTVDLTAADVNSDGTVNNLDRMVLTRYLANWSGYDSLPYVN